MIQEAERVSLFIYGAQVVVSLVVLGWLFLRTRLAAAAVNMVWSVVPWLVRAGVTGHYAQMANGNREKQIADTILSEAAQGMIGTALWVWLLVSLVRWRRREGAMRGASAGVDAAG